MNPNFGPVPRLLFRQPLESGHFYVELRARAAQLRLNFLHSQLFRCVYKEHKFYHERWSV